MASKTNTVLQAHRETWACHYADLLEAGKLNVINRSRLEARIREIEEIASSLGETLDPPVIELPDHAK